LANPETAPAIMVGIYTGGSTIKQFGRFRPPGDHRPGDQRVDRRILTAS
jgi:hypothetical protein